MPNLGAGNDQHVNPAVTPTWVFTPTPNAPSSVRFYNEGTTTVYVGQSNVSLVNGFPILPGNRPVEFQNVTATLYAVSGITSSGANTTTLSQPATAGSTQVTMTSVANFPPGTTFLVGNVAGARDVLVVATSTATTVVTTTSAIQYDHLTGQTVATAVPSIGQLRVTAGVV